jgi:hypothetical protein
MDKILLALAEMKLKMENYFAAKPAAATDDPAIKSLETQLAMSASLLSVATADLAARDATVATLTADLATAKTSLATALAANTDLTAKLATEAKRVDETLAALGVDPKTIPAAPAAPTGQKTMTREAFEALPFAARNEFIRAGGKLK